MKLIGNCEKGLLFVVSAPAGTGKTTLVGMLEKEYPDCVHRSISCTTREPRVDEADGIDYHFITDEQFDQYVAEDAFLESATVFTARYGTLKSEVEKHRIAGKHVFLVIDVQGAQIVKECSDAILIFIKPPSMEELKKRLMKRHTETEVQLKCRLARSEEEINQASLYHYAFENDDLTISYQVLKSIVVAEENRGR